MDTETTAPSSIEIPTLAQIRDARSKLGAAIAVTPVWRWQGAAIDQVLGEGSELALKLEIFQRSGSFKVRAAMMIVQSLSPEQRRAGVTAVSAGNHAIAVSYASSLLNVSAKVVMPKTASPRRIERCASYGAEVILVDGLQDAFPEAERIAREEGRYLVHPFEGKLVALGTGTLGLELFEQLETLDIVVLPLGGGGLCAGAGAAIKQLAPHCTIIGVEPEGAPSMSHSRAAGRPSRLSQVCSIADSLCPPHSEPYSFGLCERFIDRLVTVSDTQLCQAMVLLFDELKLAVEPAAAAGVAAIFGPLRSELQGALRGRKVATVLSGTNIDPERFYTHLKEGVAAGPFR